MTAPDHKRDDEDSALVLQSRLGDREAFAALYDRYARLVRAVAYDGVSNFAVAQDITQETFLRAWQKLDRLSEPSRVGAWFVGIARQICREQHHSARRHKHSLLDHDPPDSALEAIVDSGIINSERAQLLLDGIAELPGREQLAIHAFYLQEHDVQYIAELLEMSRSGVYALLQRAFRTLASKLRCLAPEKEGKS